MRGIRRGAALAVAVTAALTAPSASAQEEHLFVGSDGTTCTARPTHSTTPEPGGTWSVRYGGEVSCDKPLKSAYVMAQLHAPPDRWWHAGRTTCGQPWNLCQANVTYGSNSLVTGLEATEFVNLPVVVVELTAPHVWLVTPCRPNPADPTNTFWAPGQQRAGCSLRETFKPE